MKVDAVRDDHQVDVARQPEDEAKQSRPNRMDLSPALSRFDRELDAGSVLFHARAPWFGKQQPGGDRGESRGKKVSSLRNIQSAFWDRP